MLEHSANIVTGYFESAAILNQYQLYTQYKECFKEISPRCHLIIKILFYNQ